MAMFDWRWPAFLTRVTAGLLCGMAGVHNVFIMTPQVHARKLSRALSPHLDSALPVVASGRRDSFSRIDGRLAAGGWLSPPVRLRSASAFCSSRLPTAAPCWNPCSMLNPHIFPRLILLLPTLGLRVVDDPWSIDAMLARRQAGKTQ